MQSTLFCGIKFRKVYFFYFNTTSNTLYALKKTIFIKQGIIVIWGTKEREVFYMNNEMKPKKEKTVTQVQAEYIFTLPGAKLLHQKELDGTITEKEKRMLDKMLSQLWTLIKDYALKEAWQMSAKYRKDSDYFPDLQQELFMMWLQHLWTYDPKAYAPTTYFARYFRQAIREFAVANSQKLKQSQATNISKVKGAKSYLDSLGAKYDDSMLAEFAGLSLKVTRETLQIMSNSISANLDDSINFIPDNRNPESINMDIVESDLLVDVINRNLDDLEKEIFLSYVDYDDSYYKVASEDYSDEDVKAYRSKFKHHFKTLTALSEEFSMTPKEISAIISNARNKLSSDPDIIHLYGRRSKKQKPSLKFNENKSDLVEDVKNDLFGM